MGQAAGAAQGLRIALRHGPIANVLPVVVGTQPVGLLLAAGSFIPPQLIRTLLDGGHQVAVGQVGERASAIQAADVFEENQVLTVGAVESFHGFGLRALLKAQFDRNAASPAPDIPWRPAGPAPDFSWTARHQPATELLTRQTVTFVLRSNLNGQPHVGSHGEGDFSWTR